MGIQGHEAKGRQEDKEPEGLSLDLSSGFGQLISASERPFLGNRPVKMKQHLKTYHALVCNSS